MTEKEHKGTFWYDKNVIYLDLAIYLSIYIYLCDLCNSLYLDNMIFKVGTTSYFLVIVRQNENGISYIPEGSVNMFTSLDDTLCISCTLTP